MTVYEKLLSINARMDHHESDLYVELNPEVKKIVENSGKDYTYFNGESSTWIEIPFAYDPFWGKRETWN